MVWIPGGEFTMGTDSELGWPDEKPAHRVRVDGFFMDDTEVTNAQFRAFVDATEYVSTAEKGRSSDLDEIMRQMPPGTPPPPEENLVPGSLVFMPTEGPVHSTIIAVVEVDAGRRLATSGGPEQHRWKDDHPVVHVSWDDAVAYAKWAGKRCQPKPNGNSRRAAGWTASLRLGRRASVRRRSSWPTSGRAISPTRTQLRTDSSERRR